MTPKAKLVYDGKILQIPDSMGQPLFDQLHGTHLEQLSELASRICYDSLGVDENGKRRGRSSESLHNHILEVQNHSVYEHATFTLMIATTEEESESIFYSITNRKGVYIEERPMSDYVYLTVNLRAILEWKRHSTYTNTSEYGDDLHQLLVHWGHRLAPQIIKETNELDSYFIKYTELVNPKDLSPNQAQISAYLSGSRGLTHEQVRHRNNMSQRSTRYVDESESDYVIHPLINQYVNDREVETDDRVTLVNKCSESMTIDKESYREVVAKLEPYLISKGLDKQTARKQARGAARGFLGNALESEMIYSASAAEWRWMIAQRASKFADAEIRLLYNQVIPELKSCQYGHMFSDIELEPSPDGIGSVLCT